MRLVVGGEEHRIVVGETEVDVRTGREATKLDVVDRTHDRCLPVPRERAEYVRSRLDVVVLVTNAPDSADPRNRERRAPTRLPEADDDVGARVDLSVR